MPIYEYSCPDCGQRFERLQKMSEPPVQVCPTCGEGNVRKLISQTSFVLKGGGWYKDHYGLKGGSSESAASSSSGPESKPTSGTESKPTSGTESKGSGDAGTSSGSTASPPPASSTPPSAASKASGTTAVAK